MKYWEIIADNLQDAGFSLGWLSALDLEGRTIWIVDAHGYGKRFIVHADEMLTAFFELTKRESWARTKRLAACQANPYAKIRWMSYWKNLDILWRV